MFYSYYPNSPVGKLLMTSDGQNLTSLQMNTQRYNRLQSDWIMQDDLEIFNQTRQWLNDYWQGKKLSLKDLTLKPQGSDFRQKVWKILQEIPYGQYLTYGDIARRIARECGITKMSAQAVGGAVGHNPICIVIPCHRVIAADGSIGGYGDGIEMKRKLLGLEGSLNTVRE